MPESRYAKNARGLHASAAHRPREVPSRIRAAAEPGEWKEAGFTESQDTGVLTIQVNGDSVGFKETDNDKPITCRGLPAGTSRA